jgi:prepilin-type N-terminal cleavage/methylation domain-containing protein/prepilin-type processing-associated H-X9-DG protein
MPNVSASLPLPRPTSRAPAASGFTLIELLVVLAIVGILVSLLLPAVQSAREAARRTECQSRLRQLCLALHSYHDAHSAYPPGSFALGPGFPVQSGWGWGAMLLPYVEQRPLWDLVDFHAQSAVGKNLQTIRHTVPLWRCLSDVSDVAAEVALPDGTTTEIATGNYCGVESILVEMDSRRARDVTDGLSQTLFIGERVNQIDNLPSQNFTSSWFGQLATPGGHTFHAIPHLQTSARWPLNVSLDFPQTFSSWHPGGVHFAFGDGAVRFLHELMDSSVYEALGTAAGGEPVSF